MNLAICLYGNIGIAQSASQRNSNVNLLKESENANTDPRICYQALNKFFTKKYKTDFFIHSWSYKQEEILNKIYSPKNYLYEKQINFTAPLINYGIDERNKIEDWDVSSSAKESYQLLMPSRKSTEKIVSELKNLSFRTHSRWYSTKKVVELMSEYSKKNNEQYDFVLLTRFDCLYKKTIELEKLDNSKFYASFRKDRVDENLALYDFFFLSNQENIESFSKLYDEIYKYSIRPPFASMEHAQKIFGYSNIDHILDHRKDYDKVRSNSLKENRNIFTKVKKILKQILFNS
tara:strand:- start:2474 stop:3343 length:870 start_codon:yes stop_codon:yes gene_type:complete